VKSRERKVEFVSADLADSIVFVMMCNRMNGSDHELAFIADDWDNWTNDLMTRGITNFLDKFAIDQKIRTILQLTRNNGPKCKMTKRTKTVIKIKLVKKCNLKIT
jgi:hypothetical protein